MKRILIVDDSVANLRFVENILKDKYKLALVKSGEKALGFLEKNEVDLIVLDIMMPEMDGFETFEHIKRLPNNSDTPVIFFTADSDAENEIKALNMGAMDFIRKPFIPEVMINRINHILQLNELMNKLEKKVEEKLNNPEAEKNITRDSTSLFNQIVKNIEENKKNDTFDFLTGLLNKKSGEIKIAEAIKKGNGCLAYIDLDNLKKTNDVMGHLAGDHTIKYVGEILKKHSENNIACRLGGDEFVFFISNVDEKNAKKKIERLIIDFTMGKEGNTYLSFSSLSIGMCMTCPEDFYADIVRKADKALYHVKQSGKAGYYLHVNGEPTVNKKESVDLNRLVLNLKQNESYVGNLRLEYRDFTKVYEFVTKMTERFGWDMQLVMITLEQMNNLEVDIEELEEAMKCMQDAISVSLRGVDLSTRFSSEQFLVVLIKAHKEDIDLVVRRIFDRFYKIYHKNLVNLSYDIAQLTV